MVTSQTINITTYIYKYLLIQRQERNIIIHHQHLPNTSTLFYKYKDKNVTSSYIINIYQIHPLWKISWRSLLPRADDHRCARPLGANSATTGLLIMSLISKVLLSTVRPQRWAVRIGPLIEHGPCSGFRTKIAGIIWIYLDINGM